ncbi:MAG: hypothetical protein AAF916_01580 [Planctomycetota bacterium]
MPDARDITQRIAGWLRNGAVPTENQAAATADAYAVLTRQTAERLNRCAGLLARGLRTEAVQEADAEPELLEQLAALELPDASAWGEACRRNGWPTPDPIRQDVATLLNKAYAEEDLVAPLMREYRLRCVVRAPIRARLAALRALAGVDRGNRPWHDALVELEQARHGEIRHEIDEAMGDVDTLLELRRELSDDRQKLRPPAELVRRVDEALQDGRVERAQRRLESLLPALEDAYSAMDFPACQRHLDDWSQTLKAVGRSALHVPEPLRRRVEPILVWTRRQAEAQAADLRFREACDRLAEAIRQPREAQPLRHALDEAVSFERALPGKLGEDAQDALDLRIRQERRRRNLRWAGLAAACFACVGALGAWAVDQSRQRDAADRADAVIAAAQADRINDAETLFASLAETHPHRLETPGVRSAAEALDASREREAQRVARLEELLASLDTQEVEAWPESSLLEAESLSRFEPETTAVSELRSRFTAYQTEDARRANEAALRDVVALRERLNALDGSAIDQGPRQARRAAADAATQAADLANDPRLSASTSALLTTLAQRAEGIVSASQEVLDRRLAEQAQLDAQAALAAFADQPDQLAASLIRFAERFPAAPESSAFRSAAQSLPAWLATKAWLETVDAWEGPNPRTRVEAAERLRAIEAHRSAFPESPWRSAADRYAAYWGAALLASAEDGPWESRLPELMRAPAFRDLGLAETRDGRRFYVVGDGNRRETSLGTSINVALSPDLTRLTAVDFPAGVLGPVELSPQAALANRLLSQLAAFDFTRWESFAVDVVETVYDAQDVDAVLRGLLLGLIFEAYEAATGPLPTDLAVLRSEIALHADDGANWMNPDDLAARRAREALEQVFAASPDFDAMRRAAETKRQTLSEAVGARVTGHALLLRDASGQRGLHITGLDVGASAELFAIVPQSDNDSRWERVGRRDTEARVVWEPRAELLPEGSPIWLVAEVVR